MTPPSSSTEVRALSTTAVPPLISQDQPSMEQTPLDSAIDTSSSVTNLASTIATEKNDHSELEGQMLTSKAPILMDALSTSERALMLNNPVQSDQICTDNITTGASESSDLNLEYKDLSVPVDIAPPPSVKISKIVKPRKSLTESSKVKSELNADDSDEVPEHDFSPPPSVQVLEERSNTTEDIPRTAPTAPPSAPVDIEAPHSVLVIDEVRSDHQRAGDDLQGIYNFCSNIAISGI